MNINHFLIRFGIKECLYLIFLTIHLEKLKKIEKKKKFNFFIKIKNVF